MKRKDVLISRLKSFFGSSEIDSIDNINNIIEMHKTEKNSVIELIDAICQKLGVEPRGESEILNNFKAGNELKSASINVLFLWLAWCEYLQGDSDNPESPSITPS